MENQTPPVSAVGGAPAPWGENAFLDQLTERTLAISEGWGLGPNASVDVFFLAFLRMMSRFGVFSFGPITVYVPMIEDVVRRAAAEPAPADQLVRFSSLVRTEQERIGGGPLNELHVLLAFMKLREGVAGRVFGELGVRPEQVEEYARTAGAAVAAEPEKLYSPEEAADYLGVHVQTIRAWVRSGRLKASRLAGQRALRIRASDLLTVLEPVDGSE